MWWIAFWAGVATIILFAVVFYLIKEILKRKYTSNKKWFALDLIVTRFSIGDCQFRFEQNSSQLIQKVGNQILVSFS
ncbi:hypothetical protein H3302_17975 [Pseudoalteromonas sp. MT33b]|uniref:hypothetical protein n=1 Tax=Pseudoalteromonas sp. MT33b TaxID=2759705 RepID=UPI0015F7A7DD|nr:hypothetical protein [Pseudoalteromonas sp. MT33b]QMW16180.1 hypothetical protein H3302_17975 [Pseudoalteromonas sp. MT33b]